MMWFDKHDARALFVDKRCEVHAVDVGTPGTVGRSPIVVAPDEVVDFTSMPFADESFHLVVFDPPHVQRKEALGAVTRRFGVLNGDWREMLRKGFAECFRVLKPNGTLVFAPQPPLFGHKTRKHTLFQNFSDRELSLCPLKCWCVFMKTGTEVRSHLATPDRLNGTDASVPVPTRAALRRNESL
jgi:SAM-dependent methyltransferase